MGADEPAWCGLSTGAVNVHVLATRPAGMMRRRCGSSWFSFAGYSISRADGDKEVANPPQSSWSERTEPPENTAVGLMTSGAAAASGSGAAIASAISAITSVAFLR